MRLKVSSTITVWSAVAALVGLAVARVPQEQGARTALITFDDVSPGAVPAGWKVAATNFDHFAVQRLTR